MTSSRPTSKEPKRYKQVLNRDIHIGYSDCTSLWAASARNAASIFGSTSCLARNIWTRVSWQVLVVGSFVSTVKPKQPIPVGCLMNCPTSREENSKRTTSFLSLMVTPSPPLTWSSTCLPIELACLNESTFFFFLTSLLYCLWICLISLSFSDDFISVVHR